jgi:uncharacterized protein (DUF2336 family)
MIETSAKLSYELARELAADPDPRLREALARRQDVPAEVLYFLAGDELASVRLAVAANPKGPSKGNLLLADDPDEAVRRSLATKVGQSDAGMSKSALVTDAARKVLEKLARDQVPHVRAIIAESLKSMADADPVLIGRLARDVEIIVSAPILECSPVLTDQDLIDIINESPIAGALSAISRRAFVGAQVTQAIVSSGDVSAITHLLKNANAQIQESTLDSLIDGAADQPTWQEPLVYRPELTAQSSLRLARAVATHLLERILERQDLPAETVHSIAKVVQQRLIEAKATPAAAPPTVEDGVDNRYTALLWRAAELQEQGLLNEGALMVALLTDLNDELVAGLSVLAKMPVAVILRIAASHSPRALCALARAAKLSALFAVELQMRLGGIAKDSLVKPQPDGSHLLNEGEMNWQLEMYASLH